MKKNNIFLLLLMVPGLAAIAKKNSIDQYLSQSDSLQSNILVINSFDAMSMEVKENKKELLKVLADSLKQILYEATLPPNGGKLIVIQELIRDTPDSDSIIHSLMRQNKASKAIVIKKLNAFFEQTRVEVIKEAGGKSRTAYYDICAVITYCLYFNETKGNDAVITSCENYTHRSVISGLLAKGPDIVRKKDDAFRIVRKNAMAYLSKESPWK
ncbi:MAG: hypothetical protein ABI675_10000 [Chitinophagaceae bacterium]